jgi:hypothetical protein
MLCCSGRDGVCGVAPWAALAWSREVEVEAEALLFFTSRSGSSSSANGEATDSRTARVGGPVIRTGSARYSTRTFRFGFSKRLPFRCCITSVLCGFPGVLPRQRSGRSNAAGRSRVECPRVQLRLGLFGRHKTFFLIQF